MGRSCAAVSAMECEMCFPLDCHQSANIRPAVVWEACKRKSQSSTCPRSIGVRGGGGAPPRAWKISGQTLFSGQALVAQKSWMTKIFKYSENFQGNSVFQDKRKLLKNLE